MYNQGYVCDVPTIILTFNAEQYSSIPKFVNKMITSKQLSKTTEINTEANFLQLLTFSNILSHKYK